MWRLSFNGMPSASSMYASSTVPTIHLVFNYLCLTINDLYELLTLRSDVIRRVTKVGYILSMAMLFSERYDFYPFVSGVTDDCEKVFSITDKNTSLVLV